MPLPSPLRALDLERMTFLCCTGHDTQNAPSARVPVHHAELQRGSDESLDALPSFPGVAEFRDVFDGGRGWALFLPSKGGFAEIPDEDEQAALGSIALLPPERWNEHTQMLGDWQYETPGLVAPHGTPIGDVRVFAQVNFSSDAWYVVVRGSRAGSIWWWQHDSADGLRSEPFANSLTEWAQRVQLDPTKFLGETIRFAPSASVDAVDAPMLFPVVLET